MNSTIKHDIALLDFLRGWAAILVFFHHAAILGGGPGILSGVIGHEAVNAFMLASGFLIYFQSSISKAYQNLSSMMGVKNFAIRRFFRIAPAYYVCLVVALILSDYLGQSREVIAQVLPHTATAMNRYYIENPVENFLMHITFLFGFFPSYAFSTPLPDWSLGLEMQFYAMFPLIFIFLRKSFPVFITVFLIAMAAVWFITLELEIRYPMPTLIALKFHNFAAGMVVAHVLLNGKNTLENLYVTIATFVFLILLNKNLVIPLLFLFCLWWICFVKTSSRNILLTGLRFIINHKINKFLAEISYSMYIVHLIIMIPFFAFLLVSGIPTSSVWLAYSCVLFTIVSLVSFVIYKAIEIPGIAFGKKLVDASGK